jgi:hypothetical protein
LVELCAYVPTMRRQARSTTRRVAWCLELPRSASNAG